VWPCFPPAAATFSNHESNLQNGVANHKGHEDHEAVVTVVFL